MSALKTLESRIAKLRIEAKPVVKALEMPKVKPPKPAKKASAAAPAKRGRKRTRVRAVARKTVRKTVGKTAAPRKRAAARKRG